MRRFAILALVVTVAACVARGTASASRTPVLVELFTSEGCSSCPPADALLQALVETQPVAGAEIIALGQHVDYWDRLGWKDRFSSAALTSRQQVYGRALNTESVYTPQIVVDGRAELVGSDGNAAKRAIGKALAAPHATMSVSLALVAPDRVAVTVSATDLPSVSRGDRAETVLAVTEDRLQSDVRGGENRGHQLTHAAVVRQLGTIGGDPTSPVRTEVAIAPDWQRESVKIVVFIQERASRHVLGSAAAPLSSARR